MFCKPSACLLPFPEALLCLFETCSNSSFLFLHWWMFQGFLLLGDSPALDITSSTCFMVFHICVWCGQCDSQMWCQVKMRSNTCITVRYFICFFTYHKWFALPFIHILPFAVKLFWVPQYNLYNSQLLDGRQYFLVRSISVSCGRWIWIWCLFP